LILLSTQSSALSVPFFVSPMVMVWMLQAACTAGAMPSMEASKAMAINNFFMTVGAFRRLTDIHRRQRLQCLLTQVESCLNLLRNRGRGKLQDETDAQDPDSG
jgi:hypothetical protein